MRTRAATPADADAIGHIHTVAWQVAYEHVFGAERLATLDESERAARWRARLEGGGDRTGDYDILVVEDDAGSVVGWTTAGASRDDDGEGCGELHGIYVHPAAWGTGAGDTLMRETIDRLRDRGFREATLWVLDDNPRARRFYERWGWHDDGARKRDEFLGVEIEEARYRITV